MEWRDQGILLATKPFGETSLIIDAFTPEGKNLLINVADDSMPAKRRRSFITLAVLDLISST